MNFFYTINNKKLLEFLKLLFITLFIFFFDIKFKISSLLIDLRFFSLFLFLIMIYEIYISKKKNNFIFFLYFILLLILLIFQYIFNILINNIEIKIYSIIKIISLFFIISSIFYYKKFIINNFIKIINLFLVIFFLILMISNIINFLNHKFLIDCFFGCFSTNRFLFLENSHLAYISSPIIFYYFDIFLKKKINFKFFLFFLFFLFSLIKNQSTTLIASNILISFFFLIYYFKNLNRVRITLFICIFVISFIFLFKEIHMSKFIDLQNTIGNFYNNAIGIFDHQYKIESHKYSNVKNLSFDVVLYNFKISLKSLIDMPFGWGLFNYEFAHAKYSILYNSYTEGGEWLNKNDGSNILNKSLVELGIFCFVLWIPFLFFLLNNKISYEYKLLIVPPVITQLLIRGSGFFNGGFLVFLILCFYLLLKKN